MDDKKLGEKEELLICKYHDKECSWLDAIRVKRLLSKSIAAQHFLRSLQGLSNSIQTHIKTPKPELWFRVAARINAEEKTAGLLGNRALISVPNIWRDRMIGGLVGACAAALLFIVPKSQKLLNTEVSAPQQVASVSNEQSTERTALMPVRSFNSVARREPIPVEVDWVRSDGRVQVMHDNDDRAPIIWVKRRENNSQGIVMMDRDVPRGIAVSNR